MEHESNTGKSPKYRGFFLMDRDGKQTRIDEAWIVDFKGFDMPKYVYYDEVQALGNLPTEDLPAVRLPKGYTATADFTSTLEEGARFDLSVRRDWDEELAVYVSEATWTEFYEAVRYAERVVWLEYNLRKHPVVPEPEPEEDPGPEDGEPSRIKCCVHKKCHLQWDNAAHEEACCYGKSCEQVEIYG